ncbi:MAG: hypothetical protein HY702_05520 [Gemmatimonadetes bacterium]|nr:hypothetical protein [Gemmatimonadota bacterium]
MSDYAHLLTRLREVAARGGDPARDLYLAAAPAGGAGEVERLGVMTTDRREMQLFGLDPGIDPRRALRPVGERKVSLTNYLNFGGPGKGTASIALWCLGGASEQGVDSRVDIDREHIVAAHDFRVQNPAPASLRVASYEQYGLFWLDDASVIEGKVYNLEQVLLRAEETTLFFSVCTPRLYGRARSQPWASGLPYLALNRRYVVAKKLAATLEELEVYLALEMSLHPPGFVVEELSTWDRLPEPVKRQLVSRRRPA